MTPINNDHERHLGTIGDDTVLEDLLDRTINNHFEGKYYWLLRDDRQLIADPNLMDRIQVEEGQLHIQGSGDSHLKRAYEMTQQKPETKLLYSSSCRSRRLRDLTSARSGVIFNGHHPEAFNPYVHALNHSRLKKWRVSVNHI